MLTLRDHLDARDWRRPWRDPPGFFQGNCPCCGSGCTPACTPACPSGGSVGSDSGSKCTDCSTTVISEDFSGTLSAWSASGGSCANNGLHPTFGAHIVSGHLDGGLGSTIVRTFPRPALAGFCVEVQITLLTTGNTNGISLAYGPAFFARSSFSNYGRQSCCDQYACISGSSTFATFGSAPASNDVISMIIRDSGSADGVCTVCYKVNGTSIRVEDGWQFCFPCTMTVGILTGPSGGTYDDFKVFTS